MSALVLTLLLLITLKIFKVSSLSFIFMFILASAYSFRKDTRA
jgi:hypothetical protein